MKYITLLLVFCAYALVSGCATQRPAMTEEVYQNHAKGAAVIYHCYTENVFDADTAAAGKALVNGSMNRYTYDQAYMLQLSQGVSKEYALSQCKEAAVTIAEYKQRQNVANQQQQAVPQYQYRQPARTICNNIAGQMLCSTY